LKIEKGTTMNWPDCGGSFAGPIDSDYEFLQIPLLDEGLETEGTPAFLPAGRRQTSTGEQQLVQANPPMREIHDRALATLRYRMYQRYSAGHQYSAQMVSECGAVHLYIVDLENAYGNVDRHDLAKIVQFVHLEDFHWGWDVLEAETLLGKYFMHPDGGLIQGAPASPLLFELFAQSELDRPLRFNLENFGQRVWYNRYVDDLVFATVGRPLTEAERRKIKRIIRKAGFRLNETKCRGATLRRQTVTINGVALRRTRHGIRAFMPRRQLATLEGLLHRVNSGRSPNKQGAVEGMMSLFLAMHRGRNFNASERRVWRAYQEYRQQPRQLRLY
jgi:hypothetical protein